VKLITIYSQNKNGLLRKFHHRMEAHEIRLLMKVFMEADKSGHDTLNIQEYLGKLCALLTVLYMRKEDGLDG
jgi:hypothetical protein